jgi:SAM-dependent methyltransferase
MSPDLVIPDNTARFLRANPHYVPRHNGAVERAYFDQRVAWDWDCCASHLPKAANAVLDIGSGVGGIDQLLFQNLDPRRLTLVDQRHRKRGSVTYDVLAAAASLLAANGVPAERIRLLDSADPRTMRALASRRFDLVLSLRALGFAFPYQLYREALVRSVKPGGLMILDLARVGGPNEELAPRYQRWVAQGLFAMHRVIRDIDQDFGELQIIAETPQYVRVAARRRDVSRRPAHKLSS